MKRQLYRHVDWLDNGLDGLPLSETFIWIIVDLNPNLNVYGLTNDLEILKVMFLLAQALKMLLRPGVFLRTEDQIFVIEDHTEEEVRDGCIELHAHNLDDISPRKLTFCVTYELLYYYEYDVVKLYMLLTDDVNDLHYYAA